MIQNVRIWWVVWIVPLCTIAVIVAVQSVDALIVGRVTPVMSAVNMKVIEYLILLY